MKKILVYGFEPYGSLKENISEKILENIKNQSNLKKIIFPVKFEKEIFLKPIRQFKPDIILGLGQHPRARKIRIERKTVNLKSIYYKISPIIKTAMRYFLVNLKLRKDKDSYCSYNAGKYVCNYSMYMICYFFRDTRFAFLHVPKNYDFKKALRFVNLKIEEINMLFQKR